MAFRLSEQGENIEQGVRLIADVETTAFSFYFSMGLLIGKHVHGRVNGHDSAHDRDFNWRRSVRLHEHK